MKQKPTAYIVHSIAAAVLLLTAQISLAGSATWLLSPQDSAWENANNWTPGGPPNGPSDIATFDQSSQTGVNISTPEEVNSIVFSSGSASFDFTIFWGNGGQLIISGTGVSNNSGALQRFQNWGGLVFNNTSTAASANMSIDNLSFDAPGYTIFNDSSSAAGASISNSGSPGPPVGTEEPAATFFYGTSTASHATITNYSGFYGGNTKFYDSSTADSATLVADGGAGIYFYGASSAGSATIIANGTSYGVGGAIVFYDASTGGTTRVKVFDSGYLHIADHQSGVTVGSIEGSGNVFLGANNLTVGTNGINTSFSGVISGSGSLAKIGSGVLTFQTNHCVADTVGLILVSGSTIKLDFTGPPDVIASLKVNGVAQPPGIYGSPTSGAPHQLPQFAGLGRVQNTGGEYSPSVSYDFNGDGHPDYLLYSTTTQRTTLWYLNNNVYVNGRYGPTVPDGWALVAVGDFNTDGRPDYVLYNATTHQTAIWYMNNNLQIGSVAGPTLNPRWSLVGAADFNRDGHPDYLLFDPATQATAIYYMNNNVRIGSALGPTLHPGWSLVGTADFNRNGHSDYLLFNQTTHATLIYYMNNNVRVSWAYGPTVNARWSLVGAADFNRDRHPDYLLFDPTTNATLIFYMNNNVGVRWASGPTLNAGWSLVAP